MRSAQLPGADFIEAAISQMRGIRRGNEENAILSFNASHKNIKDAIKRGADLGKALTASALGDIAYACSAVTNMLVLSEEPNIDPDFVAKGKLLEDLLKRETFFRDLGSIAQAGTAINAEFKRRCNEALDTRVKTYR